MERMNIVEGFISSIAASDLARKQMEERSWMSRLKSELDDMVRSFSTFSRKLSPEYRDRQFARHLLWHIMDHRASLATMFIKGCEVSDLYSVWARLMPFIDGRFPERVPLRDVKLLMLSTRMYNISKDLVMGDNYSFEELMDQIVDVINKTR